MFVQDPNSIRSIARKLAHEILPGEQDAFAETISLDMPCGCPGDIDSGGIA